MPCTILKSVTFHFELVSFQKKNLIYVLIIFKLLKLLWYLSCLMWWCCLRPSVNAKMNYTFISTKQTEQICFIYMRKLIGKRSIIKLPSGQRQKNDPTVFSQICEHPPFSSSPHSSTSEQSLPSSPSNPGIKEKFTISKIIGFSFN